MMSYYLALWLTCVLSCEFGHCLFVEVIIVTLPDPRIFRLGIPCPFARRWAYQASGNTRQIEEQIDV
jgi:hypothetical protein